MDQRTVFSSLGLPLEGEAKALQVVKGRTNITVRVIVQDVQCIAYCSSVSSCILRGADPESALREASGALS